MQLHTTRGTMEVDCSKVMERDRATRHVAPCGLPPTMPTASHKAASSAPSQLARLYKLLQQLILTIKMKYYEHTHCF